MRALAKRRRRSSATRSRAETFAPLGFLSPSRRVSIGFLFLALLAGCFLSSCRKKSLSPAELRAVTTEIVVAAERVSTPKPEVTVRPETRGDAGGKLAADHIYVTLANDSEVAALRQAVEGIARRHHLEVAESGASVRRFDLTYHGERTHSIHVVTPLVTRLGGGPGACRAWGGIAPPCNHHRRSGQRSSGGGFSYGAALSVDDFRAAPFATVFGNSEEAYRRNEGVMLHLPMQSEGEGVPSEGTKPEEIELRVGMSRGQVREIVSAMLETVPHATGVNNHQGSRVTADLALMQDVMGELRARGLFFIDSRTTASTVAYETAHTAGVPAASRKVFLDDTPTREAVLAQLDLAARDAARDGSAIAIGHPHPATIAVLAEEIPRLEARGIRVVFASELVQ